MESLWRWHHVGNQNIIAMKKNLYLLFALLLFGLTATAQSRTITGTTPAGRAESPSRLATTRSAAALNDMCTRRILRP